MSARYLLAFYSYLQLCLACMHGRVRDFTVAWGAQFAKPCICDLYVNSSLQLSYSVLGLSS